MDLKGVDQKARKRKAQEAQWSESELEKELSLCYREKLELKKKKLAGTLQEVHLLRANRRKIARLKTFLTLHSRGKVHAQ